MNTQRIVIRALIFGVITEIVAMATTFALYSLNYGREPMEPPFNWTATVLQMPGILISDKLGPMVGYSCWWQWGITFVVQSIIWMILWFILALWRVKKNHGLAED